MVDVAAEEAVELVETVAVGADFGLIAQVPFAEHAGFVAGVFEVAGDGVVFGLEAVAFDAGAEGPFEAEALLVASGHEAAAGGGADGAVGVAIGEADAFAGEAVDVRGADVLGAEAADVGVAHVID